MISQRLLVALALAAAAVPLNAATHTVKMIDAPPYFEPVQLEIQVGDTVVWENHGPKMEHIVIDDDLRLFSDNVQVNSGWSFTFKKPGEYPYLCFRHFFMRGKIIVRDANGRTAAAPDFPYQVAFKEFVIPTMRAVPRMIIASRVDDYVWFTEGGGDFYGFEDIPPQNKLGRIDERGRMIEFATPTLDGDGSTIGVDSLVMDKAGVIWFTERITNSVGKLDRNGRITEFKLPTKDGYALGVDLDRAGQIWFAERYGNRIGWMMPDGHATEIELPGKDSEPRTVFVDKTGRVWFTARVANEIGYYQPETKGMFRLQIPTKEARPAGICQSDTSDLYFVEMVGNKLAKVVGQQIIEYPLPSTFSAPFKCAVDANNAVWLTQVYSNSIARFDPATEEITEYKIPTIDSRPGGIAIDHKGRIWFTEQKGNKIGMFDPAAVPATAPKAAAPTAANRAPAMEDFAIPTAGAAPGNHLLEDASGWLWFPEVYGNKLGAIHLATHKFREIELPVPISMPVGVARTKDGLFWVTEFRGNKLARVDVERNAVEEYHLPTLDALPTGVCVDENDDVWLTELKANRIARFDRSRSRFEEFELPVAGSGPLLIEPDGAGSLWVTASQEEGNYVARFDLLRRRFEMFPVPTPNAAPVAVLVDKAGLWLTEGASAKLAHLDLQTHQWREYQIPFENSEPIRLAQDRMGRLWIADGGGFGSNGANSLDMFDPKTEKFSSISMKTRGAKPLGIHITRSGEIWFTQMGANRISHVLTGGMNAGI